MNRELSAPEASSMRGSSFVMMVNRVGKVPVQSTRFLRGIAAGDAEQVIESELTLAFVNIKQLRPQEGGQHLDAAERKLSSNTSVPATLRVDAKARRAWWLVAMNRFDEAVPLYDEAIRDALLAEGKSSPRASRLRISLAYDLASNGRSAEGKVFAQSAFSEMRQLAGADDFATGVLEANMASYMLMNSGIPFEEALDSISRVQRSLDQSKIPIPEIVKARVAYQLGYAYMSWGDAETGYRLMAEPFKTLRPEARGPGPVFFLVAPFAMAAMRSGHHTEARGLLAERLELEKLPGRSTQPYSVIGYVHSAANLEMMGLYDEARAVLDLAPVPSDVRAAAVGPSFYRDLLQLAKATLELDAGRPELALSLLSAFEGNGSSDLADEIFLVRGAALCALNQPKEGFALLERGIEPSTVGRYAHEPDTARWRTIAALCALKTGQRGRAEALAAAAHEAFEERPGVSPYFKALLPELDRRLSVR